MAEQRRWVFETGTQRYRDLATGRFLSNTDVIGIVNGIADRTTGDPVTTINTMLADGRLNTADWKTGFARQIKNAYIQQAELAAGGRSQMTPQMWGSVGGSVREQYRYLDKFAKQIESKQLTPVQIEARTKMYINSSRESFWRIKDMKARGTGMTEERWVDEGDSNVCGPCADAGAMGWQPIGTFAQPGSGQVLVKPKTSCQGLTNCRCEKEYRKGATAGEEEPAQAPAVEQPIEGEAQPLQQWNAPIDFWELSSTPPGGWTEATQEEQGRYVRSLTRHIPGDVQAMWREKQKTPVLVISDHAMAKYQGGWIFLDKSDLESGVGAHEFIHHIVSQDYITIPLEESKYRPSIWFRHASDEGQYRENEDLTMMVDSYDADLEQWAKNIDGIEAEITLDVARDKVRTAFDFLKSIGAL